MNTNNPSGNNSQSTIVTIQSQKSMATALLLSFFFGPLGMLYSTVSGALIMFLLSVLAALFTFGIGLFFTWPVCMVWAAVAARGKSSVTKFTSVQSSGVLFLILFSQNNVSFSQSSTVNCYDSVYSKPSKEKINDVFYTRGVFLDKKYDWSDAEMNCKIYSAVNLVKESKNEHKKGKIKSWIGMPFLATGSMMLVGALFAPQYSKGFIAPTLLFTGIGTTFYIGSKKSFKKSEKLQLESEYYISETKDMYYKKGLTVNK